MYLIPFELFTIGEDDEVTLSCDRGGGIGVKTREDVGEISPLLVRSPPLP